MRNFSKRHRQIVYTHFDGLCALCKTFLAKGWHADHIVPYSKGGKTELQNCQPLCASCNLKKSNKMNINKLFQPYEWQEEFKKELRNVFDSRFDSKKSFLAHVGVGGGKTLGVLFAIKELINDGFNIVVVSPSQEVQRNWSTESFEFFDIDLDYKYSFKYNFRHDFHGISITYQALNVANVDFLKRMINDKTILVLDEVHHCGEDKTWGLAVENLSYLSSFVIGLSGTPFRHDDSKIPIFNYVNSENDIAEIDCDYTYDYAKLIENRRCCPISFRVENISYGQNEYTRESPCNDHRVLHKALTPDKGINSFLDNIIDRAYNKLIDLRDYEPTLGGLIVCGSISDAKKIQEQYPRLNAEIVTSDDNEGHNIISRFRDSNKPWIIAVDMIAEGVNIPRLRVCVYLSNKRTRLYITQVSGRIVRKYNAIGEYDTKLYGTDHAYFYLPAYNEMVNIISGIEESYLHLIDMLDDDNSENKNGNDKGKKREYAELLEGIIESSEGDVVNGGYAFSPELMGELKNVADMEHVPLNTLERAIAVALRGQKQQGRDHLKNKRDEIDIVKRRISKAVAYIVHQTGLEYKQIHYSLNQMCGIKTSDSATKQQLLTKQSNARTWVNRVR